MDFLKGRTNRATYWLSVGLCALLYAAIMYFTGDRSAISEVVLMIVAIPRLHDIGKSGWWAGGSVIGLYVLAFIGIMFAKDASLDTMRMIAGLFTLAALAAIIVVGCIPGQPFANRFGEPPASGVLWKKPASKPAATPED